MCFDVYFVLKVKQTIHVAVLTKHWYNKKHVKELEKYAIECQLFISNPLPLQLVNTPVGHAIRNKRKY
jgi:hypothetical protein